MSEDSRIIFFTPYDKQEEVIQALEDPDIKTVVVVAARQSGKTTIGENIGPKWCIDNPGITVMWLSPTDGQALKCFNDIVKVFIKKIAKVNGKGVKVIKKKKSAKGDTEIIFFNDSRILFRSAGSKESLRGGSIHYLIVDEAATIPEDVLTTIVNPMMTVTGRKKLIIGTPKGKNYLHKWYINGQSTDPAYRKWKSFRFNYKDNPFAQEDEIADAKLTMTDVRFQQEYLAEFVDNASAFKNIDEVSKIENYDRPLIGEKYYAGVDIGLGTDASVLSIIDQYGNFVKYFRWQETQAQNVIDNIIEINKVWKFKRILFETNNNGLPMYQTLKKSLTNIEEFSTQTKSKGEIINKLIYLFDTKTIRILKDSYLKIELEAFDFDIKENGAVKYGAASGFNDDVIMSFAIARHCYDRNKFNGKYVGFF